MHNTKDKLKINRNELATVYAHQKDCLFETIRNTLSQERSTTLTELIVGTWKNSNAEKFQNRYLYEICVCMALTELIGKKELVEEQSFTYKKK